MENNRTLDEVYKKLEGLNQELIQLWSSKIVFSWRWWLGIALTIIPWLIWFYFRDRRNNGRYLFVALFASWFTSFLDEVGMNFGFWHYDWKVFPFMPVYIPWDWTLFPVFILFIIQWKPHKYGVWKGLVFSVTSAFVFEPLFGDIGMYHNIKWSRFLSFPVYLLLFFMCWKIYESKFLWGDDNK